MGTDGHSNGNMGILSVPEWTGERVNAINNTNSNSNTNPNPNPYSKIHKRLSPLPA